MTRPSGITPEQIALAKSWWHDESLGMTAEAIGDRFGVSKSTILGLAHRGKWASRRRELKPYAKRTALTIVNGGPTLCLRGWQHLTLSWIAALQKIRRVEE